MNKLILIGRLTKDVEVRYTNEKLAIARFTVAVDRKVKKDDEQSADFPSCIAFGKTAEFIEKYFKKGSKIGIEGRLQTGSYEKDGVKHYTTDVIVEACEFVESKADVNTNKASGVKQEFKPMSIDEEENLPFN